MIQMTYNQFQQVLDTCTPALAGAEPRGYRLELRFIHLEGQGDRVTAFATDGTVLTGCHITLETPLQATIACCIPPVKPVKCDLVTLLPEEGKVTIQYASRGGQRVWEHVAFDIPSPQYTFDQLTVALNGEPMFTSAYDPKLLQRAAKALGNNRVIMTRFYGAGKLPMLQMTGSGGFAMMAPCYTNEDSQKEIAP